ncbi:hypothetical protein ACQ4M4_02135 [Leptolyngbya sp. AN02str]|uniref:hypothetical protein n=1 Tax=Leptolyngbya sp. AN02str TaxID=3423363 RepID=UPI003D319DC0
MKDWPSCTYGLLKPAWLSNSAAQPCRRLLLGAALRPRLRGLSVNSGDWRIAERSGARYNGRNWHRL